MDRNLLSICSAPRRMIFCSYLMLLAPGIFPKLWSIAPTITGTVSVLIPHILVVSNSRSLYFESFSLTFDFRRGVSVGWYRYIYKFATPVGMVLDQYVRLVRSLSVCICISQRIVTSSFSVTVSGLCSYLLLSTSSSLLLLLLLLLLRYIIKKMINIAIRATYYIFCCRNRNWDSPDLMQF